MPSTDPSKAASSKTPSKAPSGKAPSGKGTSAAADPCPPTAGEGKAQSGTGATERAFFICANWKMNGDKKSIPEIVSTITEDHAKKCEIVLAVPSCYLSFVKGLVAPGVKVGAQNIYHETSGAFTGEISPDMVKDCGAEWVIAGASERRKLFGVVDECAAMKVNMALCASLNVILCIGETKMEYEHKHTKEILARQLRSVKGVMECRCGSPLLLAYEPIWSMGTGMTCTTEQAQEIHEFIREWLKTNMSEEVANKTRILYGGLVTCKNAAELTKQKDIDGFYMGEESFSKDFVKIIKSCKCGC